MQRLYLYGAGGHASVIADLVRIEGRFEIIGLIDDDPRAPGTIRFGCPVVGNIKSVDRETSNQMFLGIGDNHARHRVFRSLDGWNFPVLIHPSATIGSDVLIGPGTVVMPHAVIEHGATIGAHCIVNNGAIVGHDCRVDDFCHVSGNSVMGGGARLGRFGFLGIGALITPGVSVGEECLLTAGSMTSRNIESAATVVGNPGRPFYRDR